MPAATSLAIGAIVAGTAISTIGKLKANSAQAQADQDNANFYHEQASFAQEAGDRELQVYEDQAAQFEGNQKGAYARGGVALAGSPLLAFGDTKLKEMQQEQAIQDSTSQKVLEANLRANMDSKQAANLSSFSNQFLTTSGSLLTGTASTLGVLSAQAKAGV
jgi:hypothetical protein